MLSASDIETYRICPLKYKFARVFRIPQEPTIHQRFGIALHQVLERFHQYGGGTPRGAVRPVRVLVAARRLRRLRRRAAVPRARRWTRSTATGSARDHEGRAGLVRAQLLVQARPPRAARPRRPRGPPPRRQLRADRLQDGQGAHRGAATRGRAAVVYQMGARESWELETSAQSYFYVMTGEKVPGRALRGAAGPCARRPSAQIGEGITAPGLPADALGGHLLVLRLPDHLPGSRAVSGQLSGPRWRRKRWKSLAIASADGSLTGGESSTSSSAADSRRSTNALTSGSLATAALTWRS